MDHDEEPGSGTSDIWYEIGTPGGSGDPVAAGIGGEPDWAHGLRQLYNSVMREPLPDNFRELLARLDK